jgi:hypothetical protein
MEKPKRDIVTPEMRARLLVNREGKLTSDQWKSIVTEPLATLLVLMIPGVFILGPRLAYFLVGGLWIVAVMVIVAVVAVLAARAARYARLPLHFGTFYAGDVPPLWMFWKPDLLYTEADKPVRFGKRLAPNLRLQPGQSYLVYYLKDTGNNVLLSIAPADHVEADRWKPTPAFQARFSRRKEI